MVKKSCSICKEKKSTSEFGLYRGRPRSECKECHNQIGRQYYRNKRISEGVRPEDIGKIKRNLRGKKIGRLTVSDTYKQRKLTDSDGRFHNRTYWLCKCECGNTLYVSVNNLTRGKTKSCGCLKRELVSDRMRKYESARWKNGETKEEHRRRLTREGYYRRKNPQRRIENSLRSLLHHILKRAQIKKTISTFELIGCSQKELIQHLINQFKDNMTLENYGAVWEIDHIKPCSTFDLTSPEQQKQCFHYTNLQPLSPRENRMKHCKYEKIGGESW